MVGVRNVECNHRLWTLRLSETSRFCKDGDTTSRGTKGKTSESGLGSEPCLAREMGLLSVRFVEWKTLPH